MSGLPSEALRARFGGIDVYLFDQLLRGRFDGCRSILDAGCGAGRNLVFFLQSGFEVFAVDRDPEAVAAVRRLAAGVAPGLPAEHLRVAEVDALPFPDGRMDAVISSAVLHFARDPAHFARMLGEMWRVLAPGGLFFARLATSTGIEARIEWLGEGRGRLPDGTERFLVDEAMLRAAEAELGGERLDPLKSTVVQGMRSMATWCLRKPA